jgi:hypothetical protein
MTNEPVAYRYFDKDIGWLYHDWKDGFTAKGVIPLYTHPANLTDDELIELFANHKFSEEGVAKFARAILRKAQEK